MLRWSIVLAVMAAAGGYVIGQASAATAAPPKCVKTKTHQCPAASQAKAQPAKKATQTPKPAKPKPPTPKPPIVAQPSSPGTSNPGPCGLYPQQSVVSEAFGPAGDHLPTTGTVRVLLLFVDFPDAPATASTSDVMNIIGPNVTQYYSDISYGRLNLQMTATPTWFRMPQPSSAYANQGGVTNPLAYETDAVAAADSAVDFSQYDALAILVPAHTSITRSEAQLYAPATRLGATADGVQIRYFAPLSSDVEQNPVQAWTILAHEFGHLFGLPDLYDTSAAGFPDDDKYIAGWDIMGDSWEGHEMFAWHRYKLGWLDPTQLTCLSAPGTVEATITPVEQAGGVKALVIDPPGSGGTRDYVAEVRQPIGLDRYLCSSGVLIMSVDQDGQTGQGPIRLAQAGASSTDPEKMYECGTMSAAPFGAGQTYTSPTDGITIQIEAANSDGSYTIRATLG